MTAERHGRSGSMPKVMVVDDAYSELQVMETILRSAGYDVVTNLDGDE